MAPNVNWMVITDGRGTSNVCEAAKMFIMIYSD